MKKHNPYPVLTAAVFTGLLVPVLVQEGMFLDGITYGAISKNMANGYGSFFHPHYSVTLYPDFHEHPPMVFILQRFFFRLFGDAFLTERIYSFLMAILTAIGIKQCWLLLNPKHALKTYRWFPVLLWITVPLVFWAYKNNLLENTVGVFTTFSVFCILRSLTHGKIIYLFTGGILMILAFLSKGPVGIFPVVVPLLFALTYGKGKAPLLYFMYLSLFTALVFYLLLLVFPALKSNLNHYVDQQLIPALNQQREVSTHNRFTLLFHLAIELSFPIALLLYISVKKRIGKRKFKLFKHKEPMLFFFIALSASIPLIISFKQKKFYLIPSIPFYILSISFLTAPFVKEKIEAIPVSALKWIRRASVSAFVAVMLFSWYKVGDFSRDEEKLKDIYAISDVVPEGTTIGTSEHLLTDWSLVAYMSRIGYLHLDGTRKHEYVLTGNNSVDTDVLKGYEKLDLKLAKYNLFKKKHGNAP